MYNRNLRACTFTLTPKEDFEKYIILSMLVIFAPRSHPEAVVLV
jgi:hypothetical protein